jgi:hypothetical protein
MNLHEAKCPPYEMFRRSQDCFDRPRETWSTTTRAGRLMLVGAGVRLAVISLRRSAVERSFI